MAWQTSNYLSAAELNHFFRNTATTPPVTLYLALFTGDPGRDGSGPEVTGAGYARQALVFSVPSSDAIANTLVITFPTALDAWGTISHLAIFDALTLGNEYIFTKLPASIPITTGQRLTFDTGTLTVTNVDPAL